MRQYITFQSLCILFAAAMLFSCGRTRHDVSKHEFSTLPGYEAPESTRRASIVFGGDVMAHLPQVMAARRDSTYDFSETFEYIKPFFDTADIVVVNLETTISETGEYSGYPLFSSPPELVEALAESGVDILALANNHICDKGADGIASTVNAIEKAGLRYTGAYADSAAYRKSNSLSFEVNGIRFALLNYTYGTNGNHIPRGMVVNTIDTLKIASDLGAAMKDSADITIIYFHWGEEYTTAPSQQDRALAQWCRERGADIVIGSHPHVLQRPETVSDPSGTVRGAIVYSLGNLVSNQRNRYTDGGMLMRFDIELSDSLPAAIEARYLFTWTYKHWEDGRLRYDILPSPVADTLLAEGSAARASYDLFMSDSRKLFDTIPGFSEIKAYKTEHVRPDNVLTHDTITTTAVLPADTSKNKHTLPALGVIPALPGNMILQRQ